MRPSGPERARAVEVETAGVVSSPLPPVIPDHELVKKIGGGSYGEVFLARNVVGTLRAVKIVSRRDFSEAYPFEREFKGIQKYEPVSRSHEGLIDILQIGRNDEAGYFYYVMELADDVNAECKVQSAESADRESAPHSPLSTLHSYAPRTLRSDMTALGRLPLDQCIQIGLSLSSALEHLHGSGLVHRDIKPSNIIFVRGVPKLADIGLVADVEEARSFVGTIGFIPPEGPGSAQADVYSLGKVLYEMVTGKDRQEFPALPEEFRNSADSRLREFNQVVLRACEGNPRLRYPSAQAMHDDLARVAQGRSAKGTRGLQRSWATLKKLSPVAGALVLLIASPGLFKVFKHGKVPNTEAVRLYDLGREQSRQMTDEDLNKAVENLNQAILADPEFVPAYVALFEVSTSVLVDGSWDKRFELQKQCARKLMSLAPELGESHAAWSWVKMNENDWTGAVAEVKRAIKLNPNYAVAHAMYGCYLTWMGGMDEAEEEFKRAQQLDPYSPVIATTAGFPFYARRQFAQAIAQFRKALELRPNCGWARMWIGKAYEAGGDYMAAIAEFEALDLRPGADEAKVRAHYDALRRALAESGADGYWRKVLEFFQQSGKKNLLEYDRYDLAGIYAKLGEKEKALEQLEKDLATNELNSWIVFEPHYDCLREDPRFKEVLKKVGLAK